MSSPRIGHTPVFVGLENESGYPHKGVLDFRDNRVSTSTGTIQLRAVFENTDKALFPGLFARRAHAPEQARRRDW